MKTPVKARRGAPLGNRNNYQHGRRSTVAHAHRKAASEVRRAIRRLVDEAGVTLPPRTYPL